MKTINRLLIPVSIILFILALTPLTLAVGVNINSLTLSPNYSRDKTIFASTENGIFRSKNKGRTWARINEGLNKYYPTSWQYDSEFSGNINLFAISPNYSKDKFIYAGQNVDWEVTASYLFQSTNQGTNWVKTNKNYDFSNVVFSPNYKTDKIIIARKKSIGIYTSLKGKKWVKIGNDPLGNNSGKLILSPNFAKDKVMFLISTVGIFKSSLKEKKWKPAATGLSYFGKVVNDLFFSPNFYIDKTIFIATGDSIYKSTDEGNSWSQAKTGLPAGNITSLVISPNFSTDNTLYTAPYPDNEYGIYKSIDGGLSWVTANTGLTNLKINNIAISPKYASDKTVFVSTNAGSIYRSTNSATNWIKLNNYFEKIETNITLSYNPKPTTIGQQVTFKGILTKKGKKVGLGNKKIYLFFMGSNFEEDFEEDFLPVASAVTNHEGFYEIKYNIKKYGNFWIIFEENMNYKSSTASTELKKSK